LITLIMFGKR